MGDRVGQQLGNYHLIRLLGQGGFAEVYLGKHLYLKTHTAIKVLRVHLTKEHEQDFLREAQILAQLEHPNIVSILDFGVHEGIPFLVMQYALCGNIRTSHPKGTILPPTTLISYLKHVASALQYAHDRKIIHRDVKPENMLLGQDHHLLLSDFGLALVTSSMPQQENVVGTVSYMAPEQLQGHPCIASDQYALGAVVYEWLCGTPPFSGSPLEIATQHLTATPLPLSQRNSAIPPTVEQAVLTALAKKPTQRFVHITAFAAILEQALLESSNNPQPQESPSVHHFEHQQDHPFVGRVQERIALRQLFRETERQRPASQDSFIPEKLSFRKPTRTSSALLLGDAGIGKTRLAEEMSQEALQSGWAVLHARSYEQESHIPYQAWIEILHHIVKQKLWKPLEDLLSPLFYQSLAFLIPEYIDLFSHDEKTISQVLRSEPLRVKEAILTALTIISKRAPLLIVLDDFHWADTSSIELFGYLVRRLIDAPILLISTCRSDDIPSGDTLSMLFSQLQKERLIMQFILAPLTDEQIGMLIKDLPGPLAASVQQQAAGNPFFAEELARAAQMEHIGTTHVVASAQQSVVLPQTVAAVLDHYLNKLSSNCRQLLSCAAVLGRSFSFSLLSSLYTKGKTTQSDEEILSPLEEALEARILLEEGSRNTIIYRFRHPLLMDRMYESLSMMRRALLHQQTAEILRAIYANHEAEGAAIITHHLLHGGASSQMIAEYAEQAGNYAYTLAAYPEAERHYRIAIAHQKSYLERVQGTQQKQAAFTETHHHQALLLEQLGECLRIQGSYEDARSCYEQALEIWSKSPITQEVLQERQIVAILCIKIGQTWSDISNTEQAQQCFELSERILHEVGIVAGTAKAYLRHQQSFTYWLQGSYEVAKHFAHEALLLFKQADELPGTSTKSNASTNDVRHTSTNNSRDIGRTYKLLACIHTGLGQYHSSLDNFNHALMIFEQHHDQREIAITCCNLGDLYLRQANYAQAQDVLQRSLSLAEHVGDVPLIALVLCNLGLLQIHTGRLLAAEAFLRRGSTLVEALNDPATTSLLNRCIATALRERGELVEASKLLYSALRVDHGGHTTPIIGMTLVALGQLRIEQASRIHDERNPLRIRLLMRARNTLQRALAMQTLEAETRAEGHLALAHVMLLEGQKEEAHQQALQILETARQLELRWLVPHIQCLLGNILAALNQDEPADQYFILARDGFLTYGMRLAYGRTLRFYGQFLQRYNDIDDNIYQKGQNYLREAHDIFCECNAGRDLRELEQALESASNEDTQKMIAEQRTEFSPVP